MSALTQIRRGVQDIDIQFITRFIEGLRIDGNDAAAICDSINTALAGSQYQGYGSVDFDDLSGRISAEVTNHFLTDDEYWELHKDSPFYSAVAELDALTIRRVA